MKKFLVAVVVLSLASSMLFASLMSFSLGANMLNTTDYSALTEENLFDPEALRFGAETRLSVLFAEAALSGLYNPTSNAVAVVDGIATIGIKMSLFNLIHFGVGMGPVFGVSQNTDGLALMYVDDGAYTADTLEGVINKSEIAYRAHADMKLGRLSFGMTYQVPTDGFTIENSSPLKLVPQWDNAKLGASVMFWLF